MMVSAAAHFSDILAPGQSACATPQSGDLTNSGLGMLYSRYSLLRLDLSRNSTRAKPARGRPSGGFCSLAPAFGNRTPSNIGAIPGRYSHINFVFGSWYSTGQRRASTNSASSRFVSC
jgi:hypothetical protein